MEMITKLEKTIIWIRKADAQFWDTPVTRVERDGSPSKLTDENLKNALLHGLLVYRTLNCRLEFRFSYA